MPTERLDVGFLAFVATIARSLVREPGANDSSVLENA
jgi:hypothetical protein